MTRAPDVTRLVHETGWVRALARRLVADADLADDLAQDALVAALAHRGPIASWRAFVATILRRRVSERRRDAEARATRERRAAKDEALPSTLDMVERASGQRDLVQAVLELEEPYRTAILWRFLEELPPRAIARRTGVPVATVHTRIQRGLAQLRARLARTHGPDGAWVVALFPLTQLPRGASPIGALLVNTSTKVALATLIAGGTLVAWRLLATHERVAAAPVESAATPATSVEPRGTTATLESSSGEREALPAAPIVAAQAPAPAAHIAATPATRMVHGVALDDLGRAVPGARLVTEPGGERFTTGPGGAFELGLAAAADEVVSDDERFATVLAGAATTTAASGAIVVLAPRIELTGSVVDEHGAGLAGAELTVVLPRDFGTDFGLPLDGALHRDWSAVSAADGSFRLADVPAVAGARLSVRLGGFEPLALDLPRTSDTALVLALARITAAPELVRGLVLLPDGAPAAGARVAFGLATTVADERGRFELTAEGKESPAVVRAVLRGFAPAEDALASHGGAWPAELVLHLGATSGTIEGRVLGPDGVPVSGALVWLADPTWFGGVEGEVVATEGLAARDDRRFWAHVTAQGDGSFVLDGLLPRTYRLRALDPRTLLSVESEPVTAGTRGLELRLPADALFAHVHGHVVDAEGTGIPGVAVVVERMALVFEFPGGGTRDQFAPRPAVTTNADGSFELADVPREGVELFASGDAILFAARTLDAGIDPDDVEIRAERRVHLQVELDPPFERADALRVLDGDGKGLVLRIMRGSTSETNPVARIENGRSHVLSLSERARWVVLFSGELEVARLALRPEREGVNLVRW